LKRRAGPAFALAASFALVVGSGGLAFAQAPPPEQQPGSTAPGAGSQPDVSELVNALLGGVMGEGPADGPALQKQVEEAGGIRFRRDVPVDFLNHQQLARYLRELFDDEYPKEQAQADERLLRAFDLLPDATDLRSLRARVLEENVAGFYDDRPGKRRLYAVSEDRTFTPMNQIVLAHEMRHALQDQYADLHELVAEKLSDFDDRKIAVLSLFEGDATLVMERFVRQRLGALGSALGGDAGAAGSEEADDAATAGLAPGLFDVPGAPPVVRDQLVQPYLSGLAFARAIWKRGGADAMRAAWAHPPASSEQVLHPALFFSGKKPRSVTPRLGAPAGARLVSEGVLGELLLRTLLEEGHDAAAGGWGGDGWRLWDVGGRSALAWRSEWDTAADAGAFHAALRARFARHHAQGLARDGWETFAGQTGARAYAVRRDGDGVELASADDVQLLSEMLGAQRRWGEAPWLRSLDFGGGTATVPNRVAPETLAEAALYEPAQGGVMATSTPPGNQTNLGMAPNMAGLLCYVPCCIGLVFSVVAAIVEKQSKFVRFHAFQSLLLHAAAIVLGIGLQVVNAVLAVTGLGIVSLLVSLLGLALGIGLLGLSVFLMIKANASEEVELPVIGPMARNWA
jgi:uncharacterized membrane protein